MKYKAIIFDLDGTLIDTSEDLTVSLNAVLRSHNFPIFSIDEYKRFVGYGTKNLFKKILPQQIISEKGIDDYIAEFRQIYSTNQTLRTKPYPYINELLAELVKRDIKCAVLSNKIHEDTVTCVKHFFSHIPFQKIMGHQYNFPLKPSPRSALLILDALGIAPGECIFCGDSETDIQTAINGRMFPVGVSWGFRSRDMLLQNGAKKIIDHPLELIELL